MAHVSSNAWPHTLEHTGQHKLDSVSYEKEEDEKLQWDWRRGKRIWEELEELGGENVQNRFYPCAKFKELIKYM